MYSAAFLLLALSSLQAQAPQSSRMSIELAASRATLRQSFAFDCCGPTRKNSGVGLVFRVQRPLGRLIAAGGEAGLILANDVRDMRWLMAIVTIAGPGRLAPWAQVGTGLVIQPGECPADGSDPGPGCRVALRPGAGGAAGVRWRFRNFAIGLEAGLVTGTSSGQRRFSTERLGLAVRMRT